MLASLGGALGVLLPFGKSSCLFELFAMPTHQSRSRVYSLILDRAYGVGLSRANGTTQHNVLGDDLHRVLPMPATYAICLEVLAIYGEDSPRAQRFGGGNERCVRQVHRMISVYLHEFERSS